MVALSGPNLEVPSPSTSRPTAPRPLLTTQYPLSSCLRHLHHVALISLPFSAASAYFPSPRGVPSITPDDGLSDLRRANSLLCIDLPPLCRLFALFSAFVSFIFNRLQPLFPKHPGGYPRFLPNLPQSRCPPPHPEWVDRTPRVGYLATRYPERLLRRATRLLRVSTGHFPLSLPQRLYRAPIAPSISSREDCQDAPNRFFGRCPFLNSPGGNSNGNHQPARTRSSRAPRTSAHHHCGRLRLVLASGLAVFMYRSFSPPGHRNKWTLRVAFFGFCALTLLFIGYLLERQAPSASSSSKFSKSSSAISSCACKPAPTCSRPCRTSTISGTASPWSIAAPDHAEKSHSAARPRQSRAASNASDNASALGDAAKAMSHKLRPTDSIYHLAPDLFGWFSPKPIRSTPSASPSVCRKSCKASAPNTAAPSRPPSTIIPNTCKAPTSSKTS